MERLFFGKPNVYKVDGKGRVSVPSNFREKLDEGIVYVCSVGDRFMKCYSKWDYYEKLAEMLKRPEGDRTKNRFFSAEEVKIDVKGRLQLGKLIKRLEEVVFVADGDSFRIYEREKLPLTYQRML